MKSENFLFVCLVTISFFTLASGIDCWVCTSSDSGCGETIDENILQDNRKTASGCGGCGKTFKSLGTVWSEVERTCLTTGTDTCDNKLGYGECTCSTTFCNGQNRVNFATYLVLLFPFIAFMIM